MILTQLQNGRGAAASKKGNEGYMYLFSEPFVYHQFSGECTLRGHVDRNRIVLGLLEIPVFQGIGRLEFEDRNPQGGLIVSPLC